MEMTDIDGQENQEQGGSNKRRLADHHGTERRSSVPRGLGTPNKHVHERHGSSSHGEGLEDFEEFVLDFDDDDLLESIHTHLGSPLEPIRKFWEGSFQRFSSTFLSIPVRSHDGLMAVNVTSNFRQRRGHMTGLIFYFYMGGGSMNGSSTCFH